MHAQNAEETREKKVKEQRLKARKEKRVSSLGGQCASVRMFVYYRR